MAVGTSNYPTSIDTTTELIEAANNAADTLNGNLSAIATTLTVNDSTEFTNSGIVAIDNELLSFTGKSGNTLTGLTRGIEGTTAAAHSTGAEVKQVISAKSHNVLASAIIALETKLGAGTDIAWSSLAPLTPGRVVVTDGSGDITVSGVTSSTLTTTFGNQTANTVFAGPTTGSAAAPTFRSLVAADIPALPYGDVTGPGTSTDNAVVRFDGSTGKVIQNSPVTLSDTGAFAFPDGIRQTFNPNGTNAGINVGAHTSDPSSPTNGDLWYNSTVNNLKTRRGAATEVVATIPVNNGDEIPFIGSNTGRLEASGEVYWDGSGNAVQIGNTSTGNLRLIVAGGTDTTTLTPASGTGNLTLKLPPNAGTSGQALITDGTGVTSWGTVSTGLAVGTTTVSGGTSGRVLYNNAGVVGEYNTTGTGDVVRATSPSLTTPNIGAATGTSLTTTGGGVLARQAATQDGVEIRGRAGGTGNWEAIITPTTLTADRTLTLPDVSGTVVTTGDTGSVTSTMIADGTIVNADISASAGIAVSKLASQSASTLLGRGSASSGSPEVITLGTGLTMSGTTLSASSAATPGGSTTQVQFNDAGSFGGDAGLTYDKTTDALTVVGPTQMSELRLKESAGGSDYVGFKAPALVTSSKIWTLPDGDGNDGQVLATNGVGTLQWRNGRDVLTADRTYYVGFDLGTCTITNASPGVVTRVGHNLVANDPVIFSTTGTLPAPLIAGAVYYVKTVLTADTFTVSLTSGGTVINTTSAGSGTHSVRTGNDNNFGFAYTNYGSNTQAANSRSIAVLTIQRAIDLVAAIDLAAYAVTIQLAPGRYTDLIQLKSFVGVGPVTIKGDTAAATNYKLEPYSLGLAMANANNDSIEYANHGLIAGTPISFVMYQPRPSGFAVNLNTTYYTYNVTTHSFQLVTSPTSTTPVTWTTSPNSSGIAVSSISGTTITTSSGHGLSVNHTVMFTATSFPTNINGTTTYYVTSAPSGTTFTISTTPGGTAITPGTSFTSLRVTPSVLYASAWTVTSPTAPTGKYVLQGLNFISPTGGISVRPTRCVIDLDTCNFGSATGSFNHVFAEVNCMLTFKNTTTISGGASTCDAFLAADGAYLTSRLGTFNVSTSIVVSNFFRGLRLGIILVDQTTYTNSANVTAGKKFSVASNGVLQGPSASIPGPTEGTTETGGEFINLA